MAHKTHNAPLQQHPVGTHPFERRHQTDSVETPLTKLTQIQKLRPQPSEADTSSTHAGRAGRAAIVQALSQSGPATTLEECFEQGIMDEPHQWQSHLKSLAYRWHAQSLVFDVCMDLYRHGLVDLTGLATRIEVENHIDKDVHQVFCALTAFEVCDIISDFGVPDPESGCFGAPVQWLTTVIIRGALVDDLHVICQHLVREGSFGAWDAEEWRKRWPAGRKLVRREDAGDGRERGVDLSEDPLAQGSLGFFMPMALGSEFDAADVRDGFGRELKRRRKVVRDVFGVEI